MVRPAQFADILRLVDLAHELHARSVYAGRATADVPAFKALCVRSIRAHGLGACLFVSEKDGNITGFIFGVIDKIYGILKEHYATDVLFYVSDEGAANDARDLIDSFISWASGVPSVIEIRCGISNAVMDWKRTSKLYARKGFVQDGVTLVRRIEKCQV